MLIVHKNSSTRGALVSTFEIHEDTLTFFPSSFPLEQNLSYVKWKSPMVQHIPLVALPLNSSLLVLSVFPGLIGVILD